MIVINLFLEETKHKNSLLKKYYDFFFLIYMRREIKKIYKETRNTYSSAKQRKKNVLPSSTRILILKQV